MTLLQWYSIKKKDIKITKYLISKDMKNGQARFKNGIPKNVGGIQKNKILEPGTEIIQKSITGFYTKTLFVVPED